MPAPDFTEHYNTPLDDKSESSFQDWMKSTGREGDLKDYDLRGYWQQQNFYGGEDPLDMSAGRLTDEFKKPNHPTFSTESIWHGSAGNEGGVWEQKPDQSWKFTPGATNHEHYTPDELQSHFDQVEPGNELGVPLVPDHGGPGQIDRSSIRVELEQNPALRDRLNQMVRGEVGSRASPEVRRIQMETAMNRAQARGHSLDQALWDTAGHGSRGYYPRASFTRGGYDEKTFGADLEAVLAGSNYAGKYGKGLITGNASADVARHQFARGTPGFTVETGSGPESYFSEGPFRVHPSQLIQGAPTMRTAEYKGTATPSEADQWSTIGGRDVTGKQIERNLERGPMLVPKDADGAKKFLKDNPDIDYKDYQDHWLIQKPAAPPLVGQARSRTRLAVEVNAGGSERFPYAMQLARAGNFMHLGDIPNRPSANIEDRRISQMRKSEEEGEEFRQEMIRRQQELEQAAPKRNTSKEKSGVTKRTRSSI
jgi:hypothetical protein